MVDLRTRTSETDVDALPLDVSSTVQGSLDAASLSRAQIIAICITGLLSALDGYDVLSITFVAPSLSHDWNINKALLGLVLSSGLLGMAAGSLFIAPLADLAGRRSLLVLGLLAMGAGSLLSALAHGVPDLCGYRVLTGLGIGIVVATITPLAAEFANTRRRPLAVSAIAIGYPIGGVVGGTLAAYLLHAQGWRSVFTLGAAFSILCVPAVFAGLPESPAFLLARDRPKDRDRLAGLLRRFGREDAVGLPSGQTAYKVSYSALFDQRLRRSTASLTVANFLCVVAVYYFLSWLPQMVVDAGIKPSMASLASAVANLAGAGACLALGLTSRSSSLARVAALVLLAAGVSVAVFGLAPPTLAALMTAAAICGGLILACIYALYATLTVSFPPRARASASGFVVGVGRLGSILGSYVTGWLFAFGMSRFEVSLVFASFVLVGGLTLVAIPPRPV